MKPYMILLFILCSLSSYSQADSTQNKEGKKVELFPKEHGDKRWKFLLGLDARRSWFAGKPIKINGLKVGAEFKGVHRFGLGLYFLSRNAFFPELQVDRPDAADNPEVQFNLGYASLFYERIFLKTRWWEVAFPVHMGAGSIQGFYRDTTQQYQSLLEQPFSALLGSVQVKFYPLTWLAIRVSGGYRFNFNTAPEIKQTFNRPFYGFGLSINVVGLYQAIFTKKENKKPKEENLE